MKKFSYFLLFVFILNLIVFSWDQHCLATKVVSDKLTLQVNELDKKVRFDNDLDSFTAKYSNELKEIFKEFYMYKNKHYKYNQWILTPENKKVLYGDSVLNAYYFKQLLGVREIAFTDKDLVLSKYFKQATEIDKIDDNTVLPLKTWLTLFSDNPDWGYDQFLFGGKDARYGECPWGDPDKLSSQGAFHMNLSNESFFMYKIKPSLKQSMAYLRFRIFFALAEFSLKQEEYFWGIRFLGCALHYFQDMTVPYHNRVFPNLKLSTIWQFIKEKDKEKFLSDITQLLTNRHFLYEYLSREYMFNYLSDPSYILKDYKKVILKTQPISDNNSSKKLEKLVRLFKYYSKKSYYHAKKVDGVVRDIFPKKLVDDPSYAVDEDENFDIYDYYNKNMPDFSEKEREFIKEFSKDYEKLLKATSLVIKSAFN